VLPEARYQLPGDEENSRISNVSFVRSESHSIIEEGAAPYMPDLAIEVQSPDQSDKLMTDKAAYYLLDGSVMVWLVYPKKRLVEVLTLNSRELLMQTETLTGGDLLPGFSLVVKDLFPN
jgi:Uma2 family endonuclease